ncbi:transmembrane protein 200C [Ambystoma mexicanum]|uniref:transmembrane protein 200C n=1 Tax=Ambystoma mexicanum TaxID=8296 RepID=UPI0037E97DB8
MIATGGLLRISARKQDPLRPQSQVPKPKRKAKKKRKNDVVVVKGKLKLCSISGLIALFGILVLLVGIAMAVIGYWPKTNQVYRDSKSFIQAKQLSEPPEVSIGTKNQSLNHQGIHGTGTETRKSNISKTTGSRQPANSTGFFSKLFSGYLHSDKLKVFGPLIMGIGIFLFICANAVLHENRDKKTKIINLRDLYSTVIDVHSLRSKDIAPLNGYVNYVQSRSLDVKTGDCFGPGMLAKSSWHTAFSGSLNQSPLELDDRRTSSPKTLKQLKEPSSQTDAVYSIYREPCNSAVPEDQTESRERNADLPSTQKDWGKSSAGSIVGSTLCAFALPIVELDKCLLENTKNSGPSEKAVKEIPRVDFEMSLTDISQVKTQTQKHLLMRRQSTSCLPDFRRPVSTEFCSQFRSSSLSSTDLDSSLLVKASTCLHSKTMDHADPFHKPSVIRRDSDSSKSDHSSNKGYTPLEEAGTSFESTDTPTSRTQDCEDCDHPSEEHSLDSISKEQVVKKTPKLEKQYTNTEKLFMISRSHATLEDEDLESASI